MIAGVTGLSRLQIKVIIHVLSLYGDVRGLMEILEDTTEE